MFLPSVLSLASLETAVPSSLDAKHTYLAWYCFKLSMLLPSEKNANEPGRSKTFSSGSVPGSNSPPSFVHRKLECKNK